MEKGNCNNIILGRNIRNLRSFYNVSSEILAKVCEVTNDTVIRWENNEVIPQEYIIERISSFFNIPKDTLTKRIIITKSTEELEEILNARFELINDIELIKEIITIQTEEDYDNFINKLETLNLPNEVEHEYYNAAYWWFFGEINEAYKGE